MSQQENTAIEISNGKAALSAKQQAVLDRLLKGQLSGKLKVETIPRRSVHSPVPLSFSQQRLWILDRLVPGNPFYNLPTAVQLKGNIDIPVFERSFNEMVRRHESMRTVFSTDSETEEPVQIILPELELKVDIIDLKDLPEVKQRERAAQLMAEEAAKPFDLEHGPLVRVTLVELGHHIHILLYTMHHIISDTWSMEIFNKELITIYSAFSRGEPSPLPDPLLQYADFAVWQRGWLQGAVLEKQLSYWRELLTGELPILELPADRQRPAVSTYRGRTRLVEISEDMTGKLAELNRKERCSMFMSLLAVFNLLLHRYSGQDEIMVGSPIANRNRAEVEDMIGFFANTLVFRTDLSGKPSFRELVARVRKVTSGAYDNQDLPFEKLVEEFQPDRYMSHTPFFQVMFVLQNVPKQEARLDVPPGDDSGGGNISIGELPIHTGSSKFDLWLSLSEGMNRVNGVIEYNIDIFEDGTAARLVSHFYNLIASVVADPDCPIDDLSILSEEEKEEILVRWNSTEREYDIFCLHHTFEAQAERTPGITALVFENRELSYEQLNREANRLAWCLIQRGVKPGKPVGIAVERSIEMVAALMGILKAGGAYMPLDPEYPGDRLTFMMTDAAMPILLTTREIFESGGKLDTWKGEILFLEEFFSDTAADPMPQTNRVDMDISYLAYIIYTSGSTGKPKGVMVSHSGISNRLHWMQETFGLDAGDRVLQKTPFSFDVSVWEFFWPLSTGARLVMARPGGHKDSAYLAEVIREKGITTVHFVPTMLNVFLETPGLDELHSLKRVICSGEALAPEYRDRFFERMGPAVELHNLYGPTEASVDVTAWACGRGDRRHVVPIGRPIANTQIYILDRNSNPVPVGVHGELYIGGVQLARGYLNRPELTSEKFNRSYRTHITYSTGDLARWQPDGTVEFIDRLDFQVKVRGFRIELGEIESNLREYCDLRDAVVLAREDAPGSKSKKLTAYVVPGNQFLQMTGGGTAGADLSTQQVNDWSEVFDDAYTFDPGMKDPTFNIVGWDSSYTGDPIPADEMRLWVDNTVRRLLSLKPRTVMEIGCGTGLFLFPLIPYCGKFIGTDIAQEGLNYIRRQLERSKEEDRASKSWAEVELRHSSADNFKGIPQNYLDLVIFNSVVQYFPSVDYLVEVLENALSRVRPGGRIFLGDIRSLPLLETFHSSVEFYKAEPDETADQVRRRAMNRMAMEQELIIHPHFFIALKHRFPKIENVELLHKYGRYSNELSKFRYDVILHIGQVFPVEENREGDIDVVSVDWFEEKFTLDDVRKRLTDTEPSFFVTANVPNRRLEVDARVLKWLNGNGTTGTVEDVKNVIYRGNGDGTAPDPDDFLDLKEELPYHITVALSGCNEYNDYHERNEHNEYNAHCYDVIFTHRRVSTGETFKNLFLSFPRFEPRPWSEYTNNPLLVKASGILVPELRSFLRARLPEYMVPSGFVILDRLPITANGKLDRKSLPEPVQTLQGMEKEFIEPSTEFERFFARIWCAVLNLEKVGVTQNFFELGGDSINAIQVISRANKEGHRLNVQLLYQNQNIRDLARAAEKLEPVETRTVVDYQWEYDREKIESLLPPDAEIERVYPTTPMQRHQMHYLRTHRLLDPPVFLFLRSTMPFQAKLNIPLLKQSLQKAVDVYPLLRTFIIDKGLEEPVQVVTKTAAFDFAYHDFRGYSPKKQFKRYLKLLKEDWSRGYQRDRSMPMRVVMVQLAEDQFVYFFVGDYTRVDGWSANNIIEEIFDYLFALTRGREARMAGNPYDCYPEYLLTLKQKDEAEEAKDYWYSVYKDYTPPVSLTATPGNKTGKGVGFGKEYRYLSARTSNRLERLLMEKQLSLSTFIQGIWALVLSRYIGRDRAVYGLLTTGRSIGIAGIEYMGGHSINILPVHIGIDRGESMIDYLKRIWNIQTEWTRWDWTRIERIHEWCGLPQDQPLFESFFVMQNLDSAKGLLRGAPQDTGNWARSSHQFYAKMEYLLRIDIFTGVEYCLILDYYRRYFIPPVLKGILDNLNTLIEAFIQNPAQSVGRLMELIDPERYRDYKDSAPDILNFTID
jgi:amino acid adenylation domain-containing protein